MRIPTSVFGILACPICKGHIRISDGMCICESGRCGASYPIIAGVPVLLNEERSLFRIGDYIDPAAASKPARPRFIDTLRRWVPSLTHNWVASRNYADLATLLKGKEGAITVLVIGAGELGEGLNQLLAADNACIIETDVYIGENTKIIADAHDIPFLDKSIDAVVIQAVLEHVVDPYRCVDEIHRVLKPEGLVYAETPFLYPVHMGAYDFTRFSLSGHRRLFRNFTEIAMGAVGGPGMALAVALRSFVSSVSPSRVVGAFTGFVLPFVLFWLKYCDYFLIKKPHVADFAAGTYFLGIKSDQPIKDQDVLDHHWSRRRDIRRESEDFSL